MHQTSRRSAGQTKRSGLQAGRIRWDALSSHAPGTRLRITRLPHELSCAQRLRELGLVEGAELLLLRRSDPLVVALFDSRIALEKAVADVLEVELAA